jgi:hypothetical protein
VPGLLELLELSNIGGSELQELSAELLEDSTGASELEDFSLSLELLVV